MNFRRISHLALCGVIAAAAALAQSDPVFTIDKVMTGEQFRASGIDGLTSTQRAALDRWLSEYTVRVIGLTQRSSDPTPKATGGAQAAYMGSSGGHWIRSKTGNGSMIFLEDGSMWEINSLDRFYTSLWLPITNVAVLRASSPVGDYLYTLINTDDGERAFAKYLGKQ